MKGSIGSNPTASARSRQLAYMADREAYRVSRLKLLCGVLLGLCFWFAVPYSFPLRLDPDPMKAATSEATAYGGNLSRQLAMPAVFLISAYMLYRFRRQGEFSKHSRLLLCALAYVAWAVASLNWSVDPVITGKRLVVFLIDVLLIYTLARTASMLELALLGFTCSGVVAVIALVADVFVLHAFAPFNPDYRFMGVMTANFQAMNLFVCLTCGLTLAQWRPRWLSWLGPLLGFFAVLLFLTRARISAFIFLAVLTFVGVRMAKASLSPHMRALLAIALLAVLLPGTVLELGRSGGSVVSSIFMMGRQDRESTANLSNRAPLWAELSESVAEHPAVGFGFEAFWSPERVEKVSFDQGWVVPHAHNSYLDQTLSLGLIGALLYAGTLLGACCVAWKRYLRRPTAFSLMPMLLLSWLGLLGITESIPVSPYLPTLIAYACLAKLCMVEDPEKGGDRLQKKERVQGRSRLAHAGASA